MPLHFSITGQEMQCLGNVLSPHLRHAPKQISGVIEHDSRAAVFSDQLGNQISHASVAVCKGLCVVVVSLIAVIQHVLQM